jgi:hypothetical protein
VVEGCLTPYETTIGNFFSPLYERGIWPYYISSPRHDRQIENFKGFLTRARIDLNDKIEPDEIIMVTGRVYMSKPNIFEYLLASSRKRISIEVILDGGLYFVDDSAIPERHFSKLESHCRF